MDSWKHRSVFWIGGTLLALSAAPAMAGIAGTGTAEVSVNFITQKLGVTATFADQAGDIQGVNLGTLAPFMATDVKLSNADVRTGGSFVVPFANSTGCFEGAGDVACPATGCATIPGKFAFVGSLNQANLNVSLLPSDKVYTFDGSVDCTGNAVAVDCTGPFALNFFEPADFQAGA